MIADIVRMFANAGARWHDRREKHHCARKDFHAFREGRHHVEKKRLLESAEKVTPEEPVVVEIKPAPAPSLPSPERRGPLAVLADAERRINARAADDCA